MQTAPLRKLIQAVLPWICFMLLAGCQDLTELKKNLSEDASSEIIAVLQQSGIVSSRRFDKEGATVLVPTQDLAKALMILRANGLPRQQQASLGEIFKKEGMISTPLEERARYIFALSQELERTLLQIDGVLTVRVHVVLPDRVSPGDPLQPPSAAVFIKHRPDAPLDLVVPRIQRFVSNSIPGLGANAVDSVSVVLMPSVLQRITQLPEETMGPTNALQMEATPPQKDNSESKWYIYLIFLSLLLSVGGMIGMKLRQARQKRNANHQDKQPPPSGSFPNPNEPTLEAEPSDFRAEAKGIESNQHKHHAEAIPHPA